MHTPTHTRTLTPPPLPQAVVSFCHHHGDSLETKVMKLHFCSCWGLSLKVSAFYREPGDIKLATKSHRIDSACRSRLVKQPDLLSNTGCSRMFVGVCVCVFKRKIYQNGLQPGQLMLTWLQHNLVFTGTSVSACEGEGVPIRQG